MYHSIAILVIWLQRASKQLMELCGVSDLCSFISLQQYSFLIRENNIPTHKTQTQKTTTTKSHQDNNKQAHRHPHNKKKQTNTHDTAK